MLTLQNITFRAIAWSTFGTVVILILKVVTTAILARLIIPYEYGLVGAALIFSSLGQVIIDSGVSGAIVQRDQLTENHQRAALLVSVLLGLLLASIALWFSPSLAAILGRNEVTRLIDALSLVFVLYGVAAPSLSIIKRNMKFSYLVKIELSSHLIGFGLVGVVCALNSLDRWALVAAHVSSAAIVSIMACFHSPVRLTCIPRPQFFFELMRYSLGDFLGKVCLYIGKQADLFFISRTLGPSALGLYGRAMYVVHAPTTAYAKAVNRVLFSSFSRIQKNQFGLRQGFLRAICVSSLIGLPTSALVYLSSREIVAFLLGADWSAVQPVLQILSVVIFFRLAFHSSITVCRASGAIFRVALGQWIFALSVIIITYLLVEEGLIALSKGIVLCYLIQYFYFTFLACSITQASTLRYLSACAPGVFMGIAPLTMLFLVAQGGQSVGETSWPRLLFLVCIWIASLALAFFILGKSLTRRTAPEFRWFYETASAAIRRSPTLP